MHSCSNTELQRERSVLKGVTQLNKTRSLHIEIRKSAALFIDRLKANSFLLAQCIAENVGTKVKTKNI